MKNRPKVENVSEQMKEWAALLAQELQSWPGVTSRRMFGMTVFYRCGVIFAALPRTLTFDTPTSVAFKLYKATPAIKKLLSADPRINLPEDNAAGWISFELKSSTDLTAALKWYAKAYALAGKN
jgi:hypothetical protein